MTTQPQKTYLCIDLKSFYASVECVDRGLDPLNTHLVVADPSRTEKTVCLAVTPPLKSHGISGRARLYEVIARVKNVNQVRLQKAPQKKFFGESYFEDQLANDPALALSYLTVPPRMARYMEYSTKIYEIYLKYIAPEDILVYSVDEVFIDITPYLITYKMNAKELSQMILKDVFTTTGITATAGIGTNLYLAKIAMDITAKKMKPQKDGVCIASLDELSYRLSLWTHQPLTDFWQVGKGTAKKLKTNRMECMGDVARASLSPYGREKLKKLFGKNAKMLIDRAWGYDPSTLSQIKSYTPKTKSLSSGQVLKEPYSFEKARLIVWEMLDLLALNLVRKKLVTNQITLTVGYDVENLKNKNKCYSGEIITDCYGRSLPKSAHGTVNFDHHTASALNLTKKVLALYDEIVNPQLSIRRITLSANRLIPQAEEKTDEQISILDLFSSEKQIKAVRLEKERRLQETIVSLWTRYGKNAVLKGSNLLQGATTIERNAQIGGHKA